jgi:hypothetical protein
MKNILFFILGILCASLILYYLPDISQQQGYDVILKNDTCKVYNSGGYVGKCKLEDLPSLIKNDNTPLEH